MSRTSNCIKMLQYLNNGRVWKISELADEDHLDTNPRNIYEYRKELEEAGYEIEGVPGRYGGYRLNISQTIPYIRLSPNEKAALTDAYNFVLAQKDFINRNGFIETMGKVFPALVIENPSDQILSAEKTNSSIGEDTIAKNYDAISRAMKNKTALKITYKWLKEPTSQITIHPYQMFLYDNEWRFFAWVVEKGDVIYLKLSRVSNIEETKQRFIVWDGFKPENYLKKNVFTQSGEMVQITLLAYGIRAKLFQEKIYGANQRCVDMGDGSVKVTMEMQKNPSTYNAILGWGNLVKVLEPQWLVDKVKNLAHEILEKYKD